MTAWRSLDAIGRHNLYEELFPRLQAKYPRVEPISAINFYSEYEPLFKVPELGIVKLDGTLHEPLSVEITEGQLVFRDYWHWLMVAGVAILAIGG